MARLAAPVILAIETAGLACSVAVGVGGKLARAARVGGLHGQAERLLPLVDRVMAAAGSTPDVLDAVATTIGPGSFTGIRVGLATARGISLATGAPLFAVNSFDAVAAALPRRYCERDRFLLVALESRREDLYVQFFDPSWKPIDEPAAIMPAALAGDVSATIGLEPLLIAGDAAHRAGLALADCSDIVVLEDAAPDATGVFAASLGLMQRGKRRTAARPLYLHPPDVTLPGGRRTAEPRV